MHPVKTVNTARASPSLIRLTMVFDLFIPAILSRKGPYREEPAALHYAHFELAFEPGTTASSRMPP